ncbi:MAG TPA: UvrD-helicase domain-containing protein [Candidatus Hydrogenedentes bacterium]|nr:UvrD-helicase domain-containing protein [Candidatus Hydrogenedentota bacterium]HPG66080.1 UvrD-helicase domain-containing protein [Candidatus Hydrogenedentota bacterium]
MDYLNDAQRQAVATEQCAALVLAGAGSGKTRVIVERIVWLVEERGVDPRHVLALTFTNRAAAEMKARVAARLGYERLAAWVGTFHAFGLYVLRREMERFGRSKTFTVFDDRDQTALMKEIIKALPDRVVKVSPREALTWISRLKQGLEAPDTKTPAKTDEEVALREAWTRYHAALARVSGVDFDDLLVLPAQLFGTHEDVREKYHRRYRHILIDEYQDTNHAQYVLAKHLTGEENTLFAVGDEDQSIYSWRGADIRNILEFERDFPAATVYRLEQNYRSTGPILDVANALVAHNVARLGKNLWTERESGEPVRYHCAEDGQEEARWVVEDMVERDLAPSAAAVLFRTNGQSRLFEEALRKRGIAYVVVGGIRFYARKEVKDLLSYLRLAVNAEDDVSLRRIINVPARGIGATTLAYIEEVAAARHLPLFQALREIEHDQSLSTRARDAIGRFVQIVDNLAIDAKTKPLASLVEAVLETTAYRDYVRATEERDFQSRMEIVDEFLTACAEFDRANPAGHVMTFLQDLALVSDVDEWDRSTPAVTLLTCHSAKGLEFDHVYLVGLEEGLLPHATALEDDDEIEEERRLCYVAMTRARESLTLTAAASRVLYGREERRERSRFMGEIPGTLWREVRRKNAERPAMPRGPARAEAGALKTGARVRHARFGNGVVMFTSGAGAKMKVRIRFQTGHAKTFVVGQAPLEILEGKER